MYNLSKEISNVKTLISLQPGEVYIFDIFHFIYNRLQTYMGII